jgi:hypothetical protein
MELKTAPSPVMAAILAARAAWTMGLIVALYHALTARWMPLVVIMLVSRRAAPLKAKTVAPFSTGARVI